MLVVCTLFSIEEYIMSAMRTGTLMATHTEDSSKVKEYIKQIQDGGSYSTCFDPISIRKVDGVWVVIDELHRAIAACVCGVSATYDEVDENFLLRDSDINVRNLYNVAKIGSKY